MNLEERMAYIQGGLHIFKGFQGSEVNYNVVGNTAYSDEKKFFSPQGKEEVQRYTHTILTVL